MTDATAEADDHAGAGDRAGPEPPDRYGEVVVDRVLTIPNLITFARLACLPIFLWLLFGRDNRVAAAAMLGVISVTDFLDGYVARHFNQVSSLGKVIDPIADRLLFFIGGGAILVDGSVPLPFAVAVFAREVAVSITVLVLAAMGARRIEVSFPGKAGTFCLMWAFPLFLLGESTFTFRMVSTLLAWGIGLVGLAFAYYAAAGYLPDARSALREGRQARHLGTVEP